MKQAILNTSERKLVRTHEWQIEWKADRPYQVERFCWISNFWYKHNYYPVEELLRTVIKSPYRYEDDQLIITRMPTDKSWYKNNEVPNFERWLFWDVRFEDIDWKEHYASKITRILERGSRADYEELIRFYGRDLIIHTIRNEISFWEEVANVPYICDYFGIAIEDSFHYHAKRNRYDYLMRITDEGNKFRRKEQQLMEKYIVVERPAPLVIASQ